MVLTPYHDSFLACTHSETLCYHCAGQEQIRHLHTHLWTLFYITSFPDTDVNDCIKKSNWSEHWKEVLGYLNWSKSELNKIYIAKILDAELFCYVAPKWQVSGATSSFTWMFLWSSAGGWLMNSNHTMKGKQQNNWKFKCWKKSVLIFWPAFQRSVIWIQMLVKTKHILKVQQVNLKWSIYFPLEQNRWKSKERISPAIFHFILNDKACLPHPVLTSYSRIASLAQELGKCHIPVKMRVCSKIKLEEREELYLFWKQWAKFIVFIKIFILYFSFCLRIYIIIFYFIIFILSFLIIKVFG